MLVLQTQNVCAWSSTSSMSNLTKVKTWKPNLKLEIDSMENIETAARSSLLFTLYCHHLLSSASCERRCAYLVSFGNIFHQSPRWIYEASSQLPKGDLKRYFGPPQAAATVSPTNSIPTVQSGLRVQVRVRTATEPQQSPLSTPRKKAFHTNTKIPTQHIQLPVPGDCLTLYIMWCVKTCFVWPASGGSFFHFKFPRCSCRLRSWFERFLCYLFCFFVYEIAAVCVIKRLPNETQAMSGYSSNEKSDLPRCWRHVEGALLISFHHKQQCYLSPFLPFALDTFPLPDV